MIHLAEFSHFFCCCFYFVFFHKKDNLCDYLFAFLQTFKPFLQKKGPNSKRKEFAPEQILSFLRRPLFQTEGNTFWQDYLPLKYIHSA